MWRTGYQLNPLSKKGFKYFFFINFNQIYGERQVEKKNSETNNPTMKYNYKNFEQNNEDLEDILLCSNFHLVKFDFVDQNIELRLQNIKNKLKNDKVLSGEAYDSAGNKIYLHQVQQSCQDRQQPLSHPIQVY